MRIPFPKRNEVSSNEADYGNKVQLSLAVRIGKGRKTYRCGAEGPKTTDIKAMQDALLQFFWRHLGAL